MVLRPSGTLQNDVQLVVRIKVGDILSSLNVISVAHNIAEDQSLHWKLLSSSQRFFEESQSCWVYVEKEQFHFN